MPIPTTDAYLIRIIDKNQAWFESKQGRKYIGCKDIYSHPNYFTYTASEYTKINIIKKK